MSSWIVLRDRNGVEIDRIYKTSSTDRDAAVLSLFEKLCRKNGFMLKEEFEDTRRKRK